MTPRETALAVSAAVYGDAGEGFADDVARYRAGFGVVVDTPELFVLAHVVRAEWPLEIMRETEDWSGDCWFIWLAAGSIPSMVRALAPYRVTKWVAFERRTHPGLIETRRFLSTNGQSQKFKRRIDSETITAAAGSSEPESAEGNGEEPEADGRDGDAGHFDRIGGADAVDGRSG